MIAANPITCRGWGEEVVGEGIHIGREKVNGLSGLWTSNVVEEFDVVERKVSCK